MGEELNGKGATNYQVKDHNLARVFDLIDLLKLAAQVVGKVV